MIRWGIAAVALLVVVVALVITKRDDVAMADSDSEPAVQRA